MRLAVVLLAVGALLAVPGVAAADSGSITVTGNRYADLPGWAYVSFTVSVTKTTCDGTAGYCGWFPYVTRMDNAQACSPNGATAYVGELADGLGTQTGTETDDLMEGTSVRLCLYVYSGFEDRLISDTIVNLNSQPAAQPAPPVATAPTPTPSKPVSNPKPKVQRLKVSEASRAVRGILRREFWSRFASHRSRYHRSCYRYTYAKVRCRVGWDFKKKFRYYGTVTMRADPDDADSILYTTSIRHKRIHRKPKPRTQPAPSPAPPTRSCDPNYSGCLDPNAYDYDCVGGSGDGPRYTGPVRVYGDDHFDLDRDGDGIGCDT